MKKDNRLKITCLGDISPLYGTYNELISNKSFYKSYFEKIFEKSDIVFCNLETAVTDSTLIRENKKYVFKTGIDVLDVFPKKFIYSIANNHILDYGSVGLSDTIENLNKKGVRFAGAGKNLHEAETPLITEVKGCKVGFIAAADRRYKEASVNSFGIYPAKPELLVSNIKDLKRKTDFIYVSIHMGMEFISVPTPVMQSIAEVCTQAGADVVFFHHSHCVSGHTVKNNKAVLWGTGNFLFYKDEKFPFKPYFEAAAWDLSHNLSRNSLNLSVRPFFINNKGLPEKPTKKLHDKVIKRVEKISNRIDKNKSLFWVRIKNMLALGYIRMIILNYTDIARRQGIKSVVKQITSSVKVLFINKK